MKIITKSADIKISLSLDLRYTILQGCLIQVQTSFRLIEINFLISIILGMAFSLGPKRYSLYRERIFNWTSLKFRQKCTKELLVAVLTSKRTESWKIFLLFLLFLCIFNRVEKSVKI